MNGTWRDEYPINILEIEQLSHDVKRFKTTKPKGYQFIPGEATDITINQPGWLEHRRAFTFTGLNEWDHLEFIIKAYAERNGVTAKLHELEVGADLIIHDSFGEILFQGEGTFIAAGTGLTPFLAISRQLEKEGKLGRNRLIVASRTERDLFSKEELEQRFGSRHINILSHEKTDKYAFGHVDAAFLNQQIQDFSQYFYVCGSRVMMDQVRDALVELGADASKVITELDFSTQVLE